VFAVCSKHATIEVILPNVQPHPQGYLGTDPLALLASMRLQPEKCDSQRFAYDNLQNTSRMLTKPSSPQRSLTAIAITLLSLFSLEGILYS
jgi:hypothetical protein